MVAINLNLWYLKHVKEVGIMVVVFKASDNVKKKLIEYYEPYRKAKTPPYAVFQAQDFDTVVTLYESGKVMFQGADADMAASIWIEQERVLNNRIISLDGKDKSKKDKEDVKKFYNMSTIGSDEVGTGDYFGPIVVSATYVSKENIPFLTDLVKSNPLVHTSYDASFSWRMFFKTDFLNENHFMPDRGCK